MLESIGDHLLSAFVKRVDVAAEPCECSKAGATQEVYCYCTLGDRYTAKYRCDGCHWSKNTGCRVTGRC